MAKIPKEFINTTKFAIENAPPKYEIPRDYFGMSGIGDPCSRKLFYGFRWASPKIIDVRLSRIFERGFLEEPRIIRDLKKIGVEVFAIINGIKKEIFGGSKDEQEVFYGFAKHAKGHGDGRVLGLIEAPKTEHLLEMKTMNDSKFNAFLNHGIKKSHPKYYDQMQRYMHATQETEHKLDRALIIATNKNTEERHYQRIEYDRQHGEMLEEKERTIIISYDPNVFPKMSPNSYDCKYCSEFNVCHKNEAPQKNCRTCYYSDLAFDGKWVCTKNSNKELSTGEQFEGCSLYKRLF